MIGGYYRTYNLNNYKKVKCFDPLLPVLVNFVALKLLTKNFQIGKRKSSMTPSSSSQWIFPVSALSATPSIMTSGYTLDRELYDRARGVEFLFRLGSSLGLSAEPTCLLISSLSLILSLKRPSTAMFTSATWFHRFFMRYSLEDYHRQVRYSR